MAINFSKRYRIFEKEQKRLQKQYEALGMTKEEITEMYEFDLKQFRHDNTFHRYTWPLEIVDDDDEDETTCPYIYQYREKLSVQQMRDEEIPMWWIDEIEDSKLHKSLLQLSEDALRLIDLYVFQGYTQAEIAKLQHTTQTSVSQRLNRIRNRLRSSL